MVRGQFPFRTAVCYLLPTEAVCVPSGKNLGTIGSVACLSRCRVAMLPTA